MFLKDSNNCTFLVYKEKVLFEYQQGVLEAECEELAYKLEHADNFKIADLEQAKTAAAKSRLNLVKSTSFNLSSDF